MMPSTTDLYAETPVTSLDAALGWNESYFRTPGRRGRRGRADWAISAHA
jgi:hypothetical protein